MTISFAVPGRIHGKGRPRFVRATGHTFTDAKTRNAEAMVRDLGYQAMAGAPPLDGPVWLTIRIYLAPPKSWSAKKRQAAKHVVGRPDCDNQLKMISDSLNGV